MVLDARARLGRSGIGDFHSAPCGSLYFCLLVFCYCSAAVQRALLGVWPTGAPVQLAFGSLFDSTSHPPQISVPSWVDVVKTGTFKELAPYSDDWYYIRIGACFFSGQGAQDSRSSPRQTPPQPLWREQCTCRAATASRACSTCTAAASAAEFVSFFFAVSVLVSQPSNHPFSLTPTPTQKAPVSIPRARAP